MIPASYLFRNAYRQAWEDTGNAVDTPPRHRFRDGLMTPLAAALSAVVERHRNNWASRPLHPACE